PTTTLVAGGARAQGGRPGRRPGETWGVRRNQDGMGKRDHDPRPQGDTRSAMKTYRGSCHCGRVQFEIRTELTRVSESNCSICRRKGYLHHMVSPDRFRLLQGEAELATYQFGTRRALHHFCRHCGVAAFYRPRANPTSYMVNARCLEGVD